MPLSLALQKSALTFNGRSTNLFRHRRMLLPENYAASITASETVEEEEDEEKNPVIYIRVDSVSKDDAYDWFLMKNDEYVSRYEPICSRCGATGSLRDPIFVQEKRYRPHSSVAAVGNLIYVFGGFDLDKNGAASADVSYIDTRRPKEGWKLCENKMPNGRTSSYPIVLERLKKVMLVGGLATLHEILPYAQLYDPCKDEWVALESYPERCTYVVSGPAVVEEGGETIVLLHPCRTTNLFSYNVNTDSWGTRWDNEFSDRYHTGALVEGILYSLDVTARRIDLCGYDVSSKHGECLSVEILEGNEEMGTNNCLPCKDSAGSLPWAELLCLGGSKLAMVWHTRCYCHDAGVGRLSVHWSTFEMMKEDTSEGLKLAASPLSHVCYHVYNKGKPFDSFVPVIPSNTVQAKCTSPLHDSPPATKGKGKGKETGLQE